MLSLLAYGQKITVGKTTALPGSTVRIPITLDIAGKSIAGLQWTLNYNSLSASVILGPVATGAGKSLSCVLSGTAYNSTQQCLISGQNKNVLANGIIAYLDVTVPAKFSYTQGIYIYCVFATSPDAHSVYTYGVSGSIAKGTPTAPPNHRSSVPATPALRQETIQLSTDGAEEQEQQPFGDMNCSQSGALVHCDGFLSVASEGGMRVTPFYAFGESVEEKRTDVDPVLVVKNDFSFDLRLEIKEADNQETTPILVGVRFLDDQFLKVILPQKKE